jgi:PAS domain S-box-containing protein
MYSVSSFQKEDDFLQILNNLPDGLFTMDREGRINYFNAAAEQITGIRAAEAMGMHCKEVFKSPTCQTNCPLGKTTQMEKNFYNRELVVARADGKKVPVICSFSILRDRHTDIVGGMEIFMDISDRKRLEEDLRFSEKQYRRIFEGSKDMILITSKDGMINEVNQAGVDLLGYSSKQELLELSSVEEIYDNPKHWQVFQKQINLDGFVKDFEAGFKKKDGTRLHCLLSGNATRGKNGEITGYEGIAKDITARMDAIRRFRQRHWELWLLNSVAFAMNRTQDLKEILMTALKKALEVLNLSSGGIFLIDHEKPSFSLKVQQGLTNSDRYKTCKVLLRDKLLMRSLLKKNLSLKPEPIFPPFKATLKDQSNKSSAELTCFLITAKEKASGFLAFEVPPNRDLTTGQHYNLLGSLGNFLGGAIENALLHQTIQKHREELKGLTARLFHSQEEERKRIARELHDEAGQALTGINFALETIEKGVSSDNGHIKTLIHDIKKQINRTHQEMRQISYRLHPALLSDLGLEPALESYLSSISKHSMLEVDFRMVGFEGRVDPEIEIVLYRLSQEALTNTLKHSRAKHFKLSIIKGYPQIIFLAEDDGIGFALSEFDQPKHTLGLLSMRERAAMLGGNFSVRTSPGKGTKIRIEIPITDSSNDR